MHPTLPKRLNHLHAIILCIFIIFTSHTVTTMNSMLTVVFAVQCIHMLYIRSRESVPLSESTERYIGAQWLDSWKSVARESIRIIVHDGAIVIRHPLSCGK